MSDPNPTLDANLARFEVCFLSILAGLGLLLLFWSSKPVTIGSLATAVAIAAALARIMETEAGHKVDVSVVGSIEALRGTLWGSLVRHMPALNDRSVADVASWLGAGAAWEAMVGFARRVW